MDDCFGFIRGLVSMAKPTPELSVPTERIIIFPVVVIILKTVIFSVENGVTWETAVLLKCDRKEEKGDLQVWTHTPPQNVVSDERND